MEPVTSPLVYGIYSNRTLFRQPEKSSIENNFINTKCGCVILLPVLLRW